MGLTFKSGRWLYNRGFNDHCGRPPPNACDGHAPAFTLVAIFFPVAASIAGMEAQREHLRLEKRS